MCKYMSFKNKIPMCENGQMCTLCVIGNSNTYKELESNGENNYEFYHKCGQHINHSTLTEDE